METIEIKIPEGKTASQENKNGNIIISFKDKPKGNIMDRVKTFQDAFAEADHETQNDYSMAISGYTTPDRVAAEKDRLIAKVLRGDWEPSWDDGNEKKWYSWFQWSSGSGFGFSDSDFRCDGTNSDVGSRLCFPTKELADYFGKQFIEIHREYLTIKH